MVSGAGEWPAKSLLTSPVCCLTLLAGEPSPACCPQTSTSLQQPPRRGRATASGVSGVVCVTLQDGVTGVIGGKFTVSYN